MTKRAVPKASMPEFARRYAVALAARLVWLMVIGIAIAFFVNNFSTVKPVTAARDAILNEHMRQQAETRPAPETDLHLVIAAIDSLQCVPASAAEECSPKPLVDRARLAELVRLAGESGTGVIAIDIVPAWRDENCDEHTRDLLLALSDASRQAILVLPRGVSGPSDPFRLLPTFFDQCPDIAFLDPGSLFFTHPVLSEAPGSDGLLGAIEPWIVADMASEISEEDMHRRRIPAFPLVLAEAMRAGDAVELRQTFDAWGLETRMGAATGRAVTMSRRDLCDRLDAPCAPDQIDTVSASDPLRINFHYGWTPGSPENAVSVEKAGQVTVVPSRFFNAERSAALKAAAPDAVLVAATHASYGDLHFTPIGRIPGAVLMANAAFNFDQSGFLVSKSRGEELVSALVECVVMVLASAVLALAVASVIFAMKPSAASKSDVDKRLEATWPIALLATSAFAATNAWNAMHEDLDKGLLTFSIVGLVLAVVELRSALESVLFSLYSAAIGALQGVWKKRQRRG